MVKLCKYIWLNKVVYCFYILTIIMLLSLPTISYAQTLNLFGTAEQPSADLTPFPKWTNLLQKIQQDNLEAPQGCSGINCPAQQWQKILQLAQQATGIQILGIINKAVNQYRYIADYKIWQKQDYWASPKQFFEKGGGDCEDYAIVKYMALRKIGWDPSQMRIVVLQDTKLKQLHSVLAVRFNGKTYIMDNQIRKLITDKQLSHYIPIYSINETGWWRHTARYQKHNQS